jgi:tRNA(Ile)-lysidine synthase TilS/MesJ
MDRAIKIASKRLLGAVRKAVQDYDMIRHGDRIAVGVSGGKDSLCLLWALAKLKEFFPEKYHLEAVTINLGLGDPGLEAITEFCNSLGVKHTIEETLIGRIVFERRKEENPCSLCANMRRGALHDVALRLGCNKVALGHHRDDVIETFLLSLFYEGRIHTFSPVTWLDRKQLHVIRPLIYLEEREIKGFVKQNGFNVLPGLCKITKKTTRHRVKDLLSTLVKENEDTKENIFGAIKRAGIDCWREK